MSASSMSEYAETPMSCALTRISQGFGVRLAETSARVASRPRTSPAARSHPRLVVDGDQCELRSIVRIRTTGCRSLSAPLDSSFVHW